MEPQPKKTGQTAGSRRVLDECSTYTYTVSEVFPDVILNQKQLTVADVADVCLKLDVFMLGGDSCTRVKLEGKNQLVASCSPPVYIVIHTSSHCTIASFPS